LRVPIGVVKEGERNPKHWILFVGVNSTVNNLARHFATDTSGNIYLSGSYNSSTQQSFWKYNNLGFIQFSKIFDRGAGEPESANDINISPFGNIFQPITSNYGTYKYISKRNPSLTEEWRKNILLGYSAFVINTDQSENIYLSSYEPPAFQSVPTPSPVSNQLTKLNSSGSVIWQQRLKNNSIIIEGSESADGVYGARPIVDSSSNVIMPSSFLANYFGSGSSRGILLAKYNSSGTLQWQKRIDASSNSGTFLSGRFFSIYSSDTDSSNNIYVLCNDYGPTEGPTRAILMKLDPLGNLLWQKNIFGGDTFGYGTIDVDNESNIYVSGASAGSAFFIKYNSSGSMQWQRFVSISNTPSVGLSGCQIRISESETLCLYANIDPAIGDKRHLLMSLPIDGSILGSYVIGGARLTISPGTLTDSEGSAVLTNSSVPQVSAVNLIGGDPGGRNTADFAASQAIVKI
jgi:hypothetical protein